MTDLKYVALKSEGTVSGLKGYIAVCTNLSHGEEVTSRGKVSPTHPQVQGSQTISSRAWSGEKSYHALPESWLNPGFTPESEGKFEFENWVLTHQLILICEGLSAANYIFLFQMYIWDIIEVVPEPGQPLTKNKLKVRGVTSTPEL